MAKYDTLSAFKDKVEWEGGVMEAIQYGITEEDIPDDGSEESKSLYRLWSEVRAVLPMVEAIDTLLDEIEE